jgi:LysR family cyn operon transcriptional activator
MLRPARYLIAVADHGSFTRAAAELHVPQPAMSQQVKQLEEALGVKLLDRNGAKLKPTDAGRIYIEHLRRALQSIDAAGRAVHDVENLAEGTLRIAFLPLFTPYMVGPVIAEFYRRHPGVTLSVEILAQAKIEAALADDQIDIGIGFSTVELDTTTVELLRDEPLHLVVGKDHPAFSRKVYSVKALDGTDLALFTRAFITRVPIDLFFREQSVHPRIAVEANSVDSIVAIVKDSRLATILPASIARHDDRLRAIPLRPAMGPRTISMLLRADSYRSAATRAFQKLMRTWR